MSGGGEQPLDEVIEALCRYGRPMLYQADNGDWRCALTMYTTLPTVSVEIKAKPSKTPRAAVQDVLEQAIKTVNTFEFKVG
jgi:hypothetical protein